MTETSHDPRRDDIASYLLGALDTAELADFEGHLAGCESCREELERLRPAALVLAETVERVEPPPALRSRVMAEVRSDAAAENSLAAPRRRWGTWFRQGGLRVAAGLAVFAILAAVVAGIAIEGGDSGSNSATTAFGGESSGVTGKVVREGDTGKLRLANVHQLPSDEVLQAWVQRGDTVESADVLFSPNSKGVASAVIDGMNGVDTVMVTAEPLGGSKAPTSKPLVSIPISSS